MRKLSFRNFYASYCSYYALDIAIDRELASRKRTNHEQTSWQTGEGALEAKLPRNLDQTARCTLARETLSLVDLGKHRVGGLGDKGGGETGDKTRAKIDGGVHGIGGGASVDEVLVDGFGDFLVYDELRHGVRDSMRESKSVTNEGRFAGG